MIQPHPEWCECNECDEDCIDTISEEEYDEMYRLGTIKPPLPEGTDRIAPIMGEYTMDGLTYESRDDYGQHQERQRSTIRQFSDDELRHLATNVYAPYYQRSYAQKLLTERGA